MDITPALISLAGIVGILLGISMSLSSIASSLKKIAEKK
jgi:hypothetical protein